MRISGIDRQVKRSDRYNIYIDDEYTFSLSDIEVSRHGFKVGDNISPAQVEELKGYSKVELLVERALDWALRRHHSEHEIDRYLARKTDDEDKQAKVKAVLKKHGFIDDRRFALAFIDLYRRRGKSTYEIRGNLYKRGIDNKISDELIELAAPNEDALKILIAKKQHLSRYKDKKKFMAYLVGKGYSYAEVKKALEN